MKYNNSYLVQVFLGLTGLYILFAAVGYHEDDAFTSVNLNGSGTYYSRNSSNHLSASSTLNNELPRFKETKHINSIIAEQSESEFPTIIKKEVVEQNQFIDEKPLVDNDEKEGKSYSYNQSGDDDIYSSSYQSNSKNNNSIQTSTTAVSSNSLNQKIVVVGADKNTTSTDNSYSFSANNSLSVTTDLAVYDPRMRLDGEDNPAEPGIPVGDGTWILLGLVGTYGFTKKFLF